MLVVGGGIAGMQTSLDLADYFHGYNFGWLERFLNRSLAALVDPMLDGSLRMDFRFERFSRSFEPEVRGANLVREMALRKPVW